jgi:hypothetical protein
MAKSRRNKPRPNRKRAAPRAMKTPKVNFSSIRVRVSPTPPPAQEAPWNSLVVQAKLEVNNSSAFAYATQTLIFDLKKQLELVDSQQIDVRVSAVHIWDLASREIEVRLLNPTENLPSSSAHQLCTDLKYPPRNGFSAVGFAYAKAIVATPILNTGAFVFSGNIGVPYGITNISTTTLVVRMFTLWRPRQNQPSIRTFGGNLENDVSNSLNDVTMLVGNLRVESKAKPQGSVRS